MNSALLRSMSGLSLGEEASMWLVLVLENEAISFSRPAILEGYPVS